VQLPKTIQQKRNEIIELLQHLMRQLYMPNYAAVMPKYAAVTPQVLEILIDLTGDVRKKRGCPNLQRNPGLQEPQFRSDLSEVLPARVGTKKVKVAD
jgi:hypothetical protein